jgi:hypothetical protein
MLLIDFLRRVADEPALRQALQADFEGTIDKQPDTTLPADQRALLKRGCQYEILTAVVDEALGGGTPGAQTHVNNHVTYRPTCGHPECIGFFASMRPWP